MPRRIDPGDIASVLPPDAFVLVSGCSAESGLLAEAVAAAGPTLGAPVFCGIFVGGVNRRSWRAGSRSRVLTFFLTPELRAEGARTSFLPLCYQDIGVELRRRRPDAVLFSCAPPGPDGRCSFGTEVSFPAEFWPDVPVRVAHINPAMPATPGDLGIPFDQITAFVEEEAPLPVLPAGGDDAVASAIARHVSPFVRDGVTVQTGLGRVPDAVLRSLADRKGLSAHTGLMGSGLMDLIRAGAIDRPGAAVVGTALGDAALYRSLDHPAVQFRPPSVTHGPDVLARIPDLVCVNSALEVDLYGQAHAELGPRGLMSGPGGASDYARGARGHGLRIVALPAEASGGRVSRIVGAGRGAGPVSLGRFDVDVVVTEHGAADLRGLDHDARARALVAVAGEAHRDALARGWTDHSRWL